MFWAVLNARPFDSEEECLDAVLKHKVQKGDAVFIRYEGPKGRDIRILFRTACDNDKNGASTLSLCSNSTHPPLCSSIKAPCSRKAATTQIISAEKHQIGKAIKFAFL